MFEKFQKLTLSAETQKDCKVSYLFI